MKIALPFFKNFNVFYFIFYIFLFIIINPFLLKTATSSVIYTVGDDLGWNSETNYGLWSQKYNFTAADVLVFNYAKGSHNVYEVTEATYRSCDSSTGVIAKYESGEDRIDLPEAKKYWFICNVDGHCLGGMRFGVDVKQGSSNSSTTNNSTTVSPPPPPPNSGTGSASLRWWSLAGFHLLAFGILMGLNC